MENPSDCHKSYSYKRMPLQTGLTIDTKCGKTLYTSGDLIVIKMDTPIEYEGAKSPFVGISPTTDKKILFLIDHKRDQQVVQSVLSVCPELVKSVELTS